MVLPTTFGCKEGKEKMHGLIEIELTRVRRMADQAKESFLVYLIDMAIIEANAKARSFANSLESLVSRSQEPCALQPDGRVQKFPQKATVPRQALATASRS